MPIHDWTRVDDGVFHDFHHEWISQVKHALNRGVLPRDYYAMADQVAGPGIPDVLGLKRQPSRVAVRHVTDDRVVALVGIVSTGSKSIRTFADKLVSFVEEGIHLMVLDLFPPGPRDPQGIHPLIWKAFHKVEFELPPDKPLTLASYNAGPVPEAFVEPAAVGDRLADMPLFLTPDEYVNVPLEASYQAAWAEVPERWQEVIAAAR
jgi:hypothetical protein